MATSSSSSSHRDADRPSHHSKTFSKLLNQRACSCGNPECLDALEEYYLDPASPYPDPANPQLIFEIRDPSLNPDTKKRKQSAHRGQIFRRAAKLLGVDGYRTMRIAVHHFHRDVIRAFADDPNSGKYFLDYLLPSSLVAGSRLGFPFTNIDRFHCLGTNAESKSCRQAEKRRLREEGGEGRSLSTAASQESCTCGRFLNLPFVALDQASQIISANTEQDVASSAYSPNGRRSAIGDGPAVRVQTSDRVARESQRVSKKSETSRPRITNQGDETDAEAVARGDGSDAMSAEEDADKDGGEPAVATADGARARPRASCRHSKLKEGLAQGEWMKAKPCELCGKSKPKDEFAQGQWAMPDGEGRCRLCQSAASLARVQAQVKTLQDWIILQDNQIEALRMSNVVWRNSCTKMTEARDAEQLKSQAQIAKLRRKMHAERAKARRYQKLEELRPARKGPERPPKNGATNAPKGERRGERLALATNARKRGSAGDGAPAPFGNSDPLPDARRARPPGQQSPMRMRWDPGRGMWAPFRWDADRRIWTRVVRGGHIEAGESNVWGEDETHGGVQPGCAMWHREEGGAWMGREEGDGANSDDKEEGEGERQPRKMRWDAGRGAWTPTAPGKRRRGNSDGEHAYAVAWPSETVATEKAGRGGVPPLVPRPEVDRGLRHGDERGRATAANGTDGAKCVAWHRAEGGAASRNVKIDNVDAHEEGEEDGEEDSLSECSLLTIRS